MSKNLNAHQKQRKRRNYRRNRDNRLALQAVAAKLDDGVAVTKDELSEATGLSVGRLGYVLRYMRTRALVQRSEKIPGVDGAPGYRLYRKADEEKVEA